MRARAWVCDGPRGVIQVGRGRWWELNGSIAGFVLSLSRSSNAVIISFQPDVLWENSYFNPYPAKLIYLNFHPFEVVSRYRDPQLQVADNYLYLFNLSTNMCKY